MRDTAAPDKPGPSMACPTGQRWSARGGPGAALLSAVLAGGCAPRPASPPPPAVVLRPAYVDVARLAPLHPAYRTLESMGAVGVGPAVPHTAVRPVPPPVTPPLKAEEPVQRVEPAPAADRSRAQAAVEADFALRRAAEEERLLREYLTELDRFRRQVLARRQEPAEPVAEPDLERTVELEREIRAAERRAADLKPRAGDSLLYRASQLQERRKELLELETRLVGLRAQRTTLLREALSTRPSGRPRVTSEILPGLDEEVIARASAWRDRERASTAARLDRERRETLHRASQPLPEPAPEAIPATQVEVPQPDPTLARAARRTSHARLALPPAPDLSPAFRARRRDLAARILVDVRAAAMEAAAARRLKLVWERGAAPDLTGALRAGVQARLGAPRTSRNLP